MGNLTVNFFRFHVYIIGTEECERSIAQSALNPSKKNWELRLGETLGSQYVAIRSHTLQVNKILHHIYVALN